MTLKYGRLPDDLSKPKLDLTDLVTAADFSMVPPTEDPLSKYAGQLRMLGNDVAGDCVAVRAANNRLVLTGKYPGATPEETQGWVWTVYRTQCKDFDPNGDPNVNGPGSPADQGMSSDVLLDYLHKTGTPDGVRVVAYGTISPSNVQAVERAIAVSGGSVWLDILVEPGNQTEFGEGKPWTDTGEAPEGGHAVLLGGYTPHRRIATWAAETTLADSFWNGVVGGNALVQRVYLVIWPEHCTQEFLAGESAQTLAAQYEALTGKPLTWPTPVTPPAPPVIPPAPSDPDGVLAEAIHAYLSHRHEAHVTKAMAEAGQAWLTAKGL